MLLVFLLPSLALGSLSCLPRQSGTFCLRLQHLPQLVTHILLLRKQKQPKELSWAPCIPGTWPSLLLSGRSAPALAKPLLQKNPFVPPVTSPCLLGAPALLLVQHWFSHQHANTVISTVSKSPPAVSPQLHRRGSCPASRPPPLCLHTWTLLSVLRSN